MLGTGPGLSRKCHFPVKLLEVRPQNVRGMEEVSGDCPTEFSNNLRLDRVRFLDGNVRILRRIIGWRLLHRRRQRFRRRQRIRRGAQFNWLCHRVQKCSA